MEIVTKSISNILPHVEYKTFQSIFSSVFPNIKFIGFSQHKVEIVRKSISSLLGVGKKQLLAQDWGWGKKNISSAQHDCGVWERQKMLLMMKVTEKKSKICELGGIPNI